MSLAEKLKPRQPRILTVDIETAPAIVMAWGLYDQNIATSQIVEPSRVLCFAAKWYDKKRIMFASEFHDGREQFLEQAWDLFDEADVVVTYNGQRFDVPHLQREWMLLGWGPPSPWHDVDLYKVFKSRAKFMSNKLAYITESLGLDTKLETGGQSLWNRVLANETQAWSEFRAYNKQDVAITELLFRQVLPWVKGPHLGLLSGDSSACYACGGTALTPSGMVFTKVRAYSKLLCECGAWNKLMPNGETRPA